MQQNRLANMDKNLSAGSLPFGLAVSGAYDAYRVLEYARQGQLGALRALAGGTLSFSRHLGGLMSRRRQVQQSRVLGDQELRRRGLLVPALAAFREYRRLEKIVR
jgi:hypothetical protein